MTTNALRHVVGGYDWSPVVDAYMQADIKPVDEIVHMGANDKAAESIYAQVLAIYWGYAE